MPCYSQSLEVSTSPSGSVGKLYTHPVLTRDIQWQGNCALGGIVAQSSRYNLHSRGIDEPQAFLMVHLLPSVVSQHFLSSMHSLKRLARFAFVSSSDPNVSLGYSALTNNLAQASSRLGLVQLPNDVVVMGQRPSKSMLCDKDAAECCAAFRASACPSLSIASSRSRTFAPCQAPASLVQKTCFMPTDAMYDMHQ
jgi:hypothetical protein